MSFNEHITNKQKYSIFASWTFIYYTRYLPFLYIYHAKYINRRNYVFLRRKVTLWLYPKQKYANWQYSSPAAFKVHEAREGRQFVTLSTALRMLRLYNNRIIADYNSHHRLRAPINFGEYEDWSDFPDNAYRQHCIKFINLQITLWTLSDYLVVSKILWPIHAEPANCTH